MNGNLDPCKEAACWCVPAEFVRPRFFYGQRLGVIDFSDWLRYHAGKQRFHNLLCHGVGVLCGLRAELYLSHGEATTTLLRVTRGAALDDCGREVVVGVDQCIDVAAWYRNHLDCEQIAEWAQSDNPRLCIGLRYRECPSDPAPAPRDPCGCDAGGCEYARVRESFELRLFPSDAVPEAAPRMDCAAYDALVELLASRSDSAADTCAALREILHGLIPTECPPPSDDAWLWLACFGVTLDEDRQEVTAIEAPDNAIEQRMEILKTAALQEILLGMALSAPAEEAGPRFSAVTLPDDGNLRLDVTLFQDPDRSSSSPLEVDNTIVADYFHLYRFRAPQPRVASGDAVRFEPPSGTKPWRIIKLKTVEYKKSNDPHFYIIPAGTLKQGRYRLTFISPPESPIVDTGMRPLLPLTYSCNFQILPGDGGGHVLEVLS